MNIFSMLASIVFIGCAFIVMDAEIDGKNRMSVVVVAVIAMLIGLCSFAYFVVQSGALNRSI